ncbi:MAG: DUF2029 domain-containing protein [Saprospiraceae bacterium]|nr:DUF2029 domain-containing protein [Saprospiraceae bacterium]
MNKKLKFSIAIISLLLLALVYELFRDTFTKAGDFIGYVMAGNLVLEGKDIYTNPLINTWPPFFSIVSVPIALLDNFNKYFVRFLWLAGSLYAMFIIMKYTVKLVLKKDLKLYPFHVENNSFKNVTSITEWVILIPFLIIFRYVLDNLSNIQINIYMLFFAMSSIWLFVKNRHLPAALILAFSISIKVYTIFLLIYFIIKREYRIASYAILFCLIFALIPFLVFGYSQSIEYYTFWYHNAVAPFADVGHKNQSFFSMMRSLLAHESPGLNQPLNKELYINILDLPIQQVKLISYSIVFLAGLLVTYLFRNKLSDKSNLKAFLEYALILNVTPLLSPLAWKAYFIFLFPSYFMNYLLIYANPVTLGKKTALYVKLSYYISILLVVFSSELFLGGYLSDVFEAYSCITVGSILIAINLLIFHQNADEHKVL